MHRARIIRHANLGTLNKRCQFCGRRFAGKITCAGCGGCDLSASRLRSEEHTSELQSRLHLVCRLLLEKKKMNRGFRPNRGVHVVLRDLDVGSWWNRGEYS